MLSVLRTWWTAAAALAVLMLLPYGTEPVAAKPSGLFNNFTGTWRGSGRIRLQGGRSNRISCRAYYTVRRGGSRLGLAIRCASTSNKIELRAVVFDNGGRLSGTWEERTFNASGAVTGNVRPGRLSMSVNGAITGSMNISYSGSRQSVDISTAGSQLQGISITLRR